MAESDVFIDSAQDDSASVPLRALLQDDQDARAALCTELEQLADALPALPTPARVRRLCNQIDIVTSIHFRRADAILAEAAAGFDVPPASGALEQLAEMHAMDTMHGEDLISVLWDSVARGTVARPGEFGYMLRCFFDGCRRAVALENMVLTLIEREALHQG
ncbi:hypothetical protein GCM10009087_53760 [Sphingomonas oligophenolica]|uniref:Hemerythrin-like domain-containing protein n=1 Tax=Sphingomonas oligophenolica TaxID=301154 RepID=A0ABU9Y7P2_9SPHN